MTRWTDWLVALGWNLARLFGVPAPASAAASSATAGHVLMPGASAWLDAPSFLPAVQAGGIGPS